jgi:hypothetical protein
VPVNILALIAAFSTSIGFGPVQSSKLDVDVSNLPTLLQLVVDCSGIIGVNPQYEVLRKNIEIFSRELVYSIHICHSRLLGAMHN